MLSRNPITISLEQERLRNSVEKWEKCTKNSSKNCTGHRVWKKAMKKPARNRSLKKEKKGFEMATASLYAGRWMAMGNFANDCNNTYDCSSQ